MFVVKSNHQLTLGSNGLKQLATSQQCLWTLRTDDLLLILGMSHFLQFGALNCKGEFRVA